MKIVIEIEGTTPAFEEDSTWVPGNFAAAFEVSRILHGISSMITGRGMDGTDSVITLYDSDRRPVGTFTIVR